MLYVGENKQRKSIIPLKKKSVISCLAENILFLGVQFKTHPFISLLFFSCLHVKLPLKSAESLGLRRTGEAEGIQGKLAKTHSRMAWLRSYGISPSGLECAWQLSQARVSELFFFFF